MRALVLVLVLALLLPAGVRAECFPDCEREIAGNSEMIHSLLKRMEYMEGRHSKIVAELEDKLRDVLERVLIIEDKLQIKNYLRYMPEEPGPRPITNDELKLVVCMAGMERRAKLGEIANDPDEMFRTCKAR